MPALKKKKKYMCNYHFVAEAQDVHPDLKHTECSGVSSPKMAKYGCKAWERHMKKLRRMS